MASLKMANLTIPLVTQGGNNPLPSTYSSSFTTSVLIPLIVLAYLGGHIGPLLHGGLWINGILNLPCMAACEPHTRAS